MKKIILSSTLALLVSFSASAQLGGALNKLKSKAKESTKEENPANNATPVQNNQPAKENTTLAKKSDGITSPMHEKYMSKIVFTKLPTQKGTENEADFLKEVTLGDGELFFRVYLKNTLLELMKPGCGGESESNILSGARFYYKYYVDGKEIDFESSSDSDFEYEEKEQWTTFKGALYSSKQMGDYLGDKQFRNFIVKAGTVLTVGSHVLKIEVIPSECANWKNKNNDIQNVAASGEIKINITADFQKNFFTRYLPFTPGSTIVNAEFTKLIKDKFKAEGWGTIYKIELRDNAWIIEKSYVGLVLNRHFSAAIAFQNPKGECIYDIYIVTQDWDGVSYQKDIQWSWDQNGKAEEFHVPSFYIKN